MERKVIVICGVVGFLGLLSAIIGFAVEATRTKVNAAGDLGAIFLEKLHTPILLRCKLSPLASSMAQTLKIG